MKARNGNLYHTLLAIRLRVIDIEFNYMSTWLFIASRNIILHYLRADFMLHFLLD